MTFSENLRSLETATRRKKRLQCKMCDSFDVWRIRDRAGLFGLILRLRGRKTFQCRACGWMCYPVMRRKTDAALENPPAGTPAPATKTEQRTS